MSRRRRDFTSRPVDGRLRQAGLTLLELLVAMAISLVLVLAAAYIYLNTREAQRSLDQISSLNDTGAYVLQTIGREVMNAGFYPAVRAETSDTSNSVSKYLNIVDPGSLTSAYNAGVYGCDSATFDPKGGGCNGAVAGTPDSIVVNYFTNDTFGLDVGQRADCTHQDVGGAPENKTRVGAGAATVPPAQPLFVSNRFVLVPETFKINNTEQVKTYSLACNGNATPGAEYQKLLAGIEDLQITYGIAAATTGTTPQQYLSANDINKLAGASSADKWGRVVSVRICVMARSYETPAHAVESASAVRSYVDCNDATQNYATTDTSVRKRFVQIFGLRNRLTQTY